MSKIFYDQIIVLEEVEKEINSTTQTHEERQDLWQIVDEIVHHKVMDCILDKLPGEHHEEFLDKFQSAPHNHSHFDYLKEKIGDCRCRTKRQS